MNKIQTKDGRTIYFGEQEGPEWFNLRAGCFSGSDIAPVLVGDGKSPGVNTLISKRIKQIIYDYEDIDPISSAAVEWGNEWEPVAFREYCEKYFLLDCKKVRFVKVLDNLGFSPDGIFIKDNVINKGAEIKCPHNPDNHINHLQIKNAEDLKRINKKYFAQVQFCMWAAGPSCLTWDFVSFDPRLMDTNFKHIALHKAEIKKCKKTCDLFSQRMPGNIKKLQERLNQILKGC